MYKNQKMYDQKGSNKLTIAITILVVLALGISLSFLVIKNDKTNPEPLYGNWICRELDSEEDDLGFNLDKKGNVEEYYPGDKEILDVIGKYTIDAKEENDDNIRYTITLTSNNRVVVGVKRNNNFKDKFIIEINTKEPKKMTLKDSTETNVFYCKK